HIIYIHVYAPQHVVSVYTIPLNRLYAGAPLVAFVITEQDVDLVFEDGVDARLPGLHPLAKHFRATRDVAARMGGESLTLSAGERIDLNHSYKYDAATFLRILADAGFAVRWRGTSDDARFQMVLAGPA